MYPAAGKERLQSLCQLPQIPLQPKDSYFTRVFRTHSLVLLVFNPYEIASGMSQMTLGTQMCAACTEVKHASFRFCSLVKTEIPLSSSSAPPDIRGTSPPTPTETASLFVLVSLLFCLANRNSCKC